MRQESILEEDDSPKAKGGLSLVYRFISFKKLRSIPDEK
jgi:hypothetical protein